MGLCDSEVNIDVMLEHIMPLEQVSVQYAPVLPLLLPPLLVEVGGQHLQPHRVDTRHVPHVHGLGVT